MARTAVLWLTLLCATAGAQTASDRETARSLMDQGTAAMTRGQHRAALQAFQAADRIMSVPTTGIAVARAQAALGQLVDARDTALRVARIPTKPDEPSVFGEARSEARSLADTLAGRIASLTITLGPSAPAGATVTLDGSEVAAALRGVPKKIDPGKHVIVARAAGYDEARVEVTLGDGAAETITLELRPKRVAPMPPDGPHPPGAQGATSNGVSPLVYIGFGLGAAGVAVGSVTGLMSLSKASSAKERCEGNVCPTTAREDADASKQLATISNIGFAAGIVGIGVGIYGLLRQQPANREQVTARKARVEPIVGARFVGVHGSF